MKKLIFGSIILTLSLFVFANIAGAKVDRVPGGFGQWEFTAPKTITFTCGGSWYQAIADAEKALGGVEKIRSTFFDFQKILYSKVNL